MAQANLVTPLDKVRGKMNNMDFSVNGESQLVRGHVKPDDPSSNPQQVIRGILTTVSQGFKALSRAVIDTWDAAAALLPKRTNRAGYEYPVTARTLYQEVNTYRMLNGLTLSSTAPGTAYPSVPIIIDDAEFDDDEGIMFIPVENGANLNDTDIFRTRITYPLRTTAVLARENDLRYPNPNDTQVAFITGNEIKAQGNKISIPCVSELAAAFAVASIKRFGFEVVCLNPSYVRTNDPLFFDSWSYSIMT